MSRVTTRRNIIPKLGAVAAIAVLLSGCLAIPDHCKSKAEAKADTRPRQARLLQEFASQPLGAPGGEFTVFTPKRSANHPGGAPVIVLHEMPALSPDLLELALRLSREGYSVYVPLLWGAANENAVSKFLFVRRGLELRSSPEWRAGEADVERPIVDRLAALSRQIGTLHPGKRIGIIGNCLTGILAFAVAARVPEVAAPVASQPTLPLTFSKWPRGYTGLSPTETAALQRRVATEGTFQLLGLRFAEDRASPPERFTALEGAFPHRRFLNLTIPVALYHGRDRLGRHVHAVLTECYSKNENFASHRAWRETVNFLDAKLKGDKPRWYALGWP